MTVPTRLLVLDLDGTLLRSDGSLSARSVAALRLAHRAGYLVLYASARPLESLTRKVEEVGIRAAAISSNGAVTTGLEGGAPRIRALRGDVASALLEESNEQWPLSTWAADTVEGRLTGPGWQGALSSDPCVSAVPSLPLDADVLCLMLEGVPATVHDGSRHRRRIAVTSSRTGLVEVSALGATKAEALRCFCESVSVELAQVTAFGDMHNDLGILSIVGTAVAVANACPELHAIADHIVPSNDDDGVAIFLESLLRNERG